MVHPGGVQDIQHSSTPLPGEGHQPPAAGQPPGRNPQRWCLLRSQVHLHHLQGVPEHGLPLGEAGSVHRDRPLYLRAPAQPVAGLAPAQEDGQRAARDGPRRGERQLRGQLPLPLPPAHHGGVPHRLLHLPPALRQRGAGHCGFLQLGAVRARHHQADPLEKEIQGGDQQARQRVPRARHRQPDQLRDGEVLQQRGARGGAVLPGSDPVPEVQHRHAVLPLPAQHQPAGPADRMHVPGHDHHDLLQERRWSVRGGAGVSHPALPAAQLSGLHLRSDCERLGGCAEPERAAGREP
mmetsp:Transcript_33592/g.73314  ORF Transcript_33592/g.73314 Transcript_33592/m.73314 type:complete len:294 (+) Transcript_33592:648-1529(+)